MTTTTKIKAAMLQKGLTQSDLARQSGVNVWSLNRFVTGAARPSAATLARLAQALGCKPAELQEVAQ